MKPLLDLMLKLKQMVPINYATSIVGAQLRFDMSDGTLPIDTTNRVNLNAIIKELLWSISGSNDIKQLKGSGLTDLASVAVTKASIDKYAKIHANGDDQLERALIGHWTNNHLDSVGETTGTSWRNSVRKEIMTLWPDIPDACFPSDKVKLWEVEYKEIKETAKDEIISFNTFCKYKYYETVDQLNELINNLKTNPYIPIPEVIGFSPACETFADLSYQENILLSRSSGFGNKESFQCVIKPAKDTNLKSALSMVVTQSEAQVHTLGSYTIPKYALLMTLIAHVTDLEPLELVVNVGNVYLNKENMGLVDTQLCRVPFDSPKCVINPDKRDLFDITFEDIQIVDYQSHSPIAYLK